jgi:hypothetical protein
MSSPARVPVFAYGSNLSTFRLRARTPSARPIGVAELHEHELRWHKRGRDGSGKCDVEAGSGSVWGVVYEIAVAEKPLLDAAEGLHRGYAEREVVVVGAELGTVRASLYQATDIEPSLRPFDWYKAFVLAGAREHALPTAYVERIAAVASRPDPDRARARRMRSLLPP